MLAATFLFVMPHGPVLSSTCIWQPAACYLVDGGWGCRREDKKVGLKLSKTLTHQSPAVLPPPDFANPKAKLCQTNSLLQGVWRHPGVREAIRKAKGGSGPFQVCHSVSPSLHIHKILHSVNMLLCTSASLARTIWQSASIALQIVIASQHDSNLVQALASSSCVPFSPSNLHLCQCMNIIQALGLCLCLTCLCK